MIDEQLLPKLAAHNQCYRAEERGYLSKRKGFVKVAMQAGADIVPSYILGQSQEINESAGIMQVGSHSVLTKPHGLWSIAIVCFKKHSVDGYSFKYQILLQVIMYKGSETLSRRF